MKRTPFCRKRELKRLLQRELDVTKLSLMRAATQHDRLVLMRRIEELRKWVSDDDPLGA